MGMFDILIFPIKCPTCGKNRNREWQTKYWQQKQLSFEGSTHKVGENVEDETGIIGCIGNCPVCRTQHSVDVIIENNIITNKYKDVESRKEFLSRVNCRR